MVTTEDEAVSRAETVARDVTAGEADALDQPGGWPAKTMKALGKAGLLGLVVPQQAGGLGLGLTSLLRSCEHLGYRSAPAGLVFGMHCVGTAVIAAKATPFHVQEFLRPIAAGNHVTTLALSEAETGLHFYYPRSRLAEGRGGRLVLSGNKSLTTSGAFADSYVVSTRSMDSEAPAGLFSMAVLPKASKGLEWGPEFAGIGMRGNSSRGFQMRDVEIDRRNLLGEDGDQIWYIFHVVAPYFLVAMAGTYLGLARHAYELAREHLRRREYAHSKTSLSDEPVLQHSLGRMWANIQRTRQLALWACRQGDEGADDAVPALCAAKAEVGDCAVDVVNEAMTMAGGIGYRDGGPLERLLRDARAAHVMAPTTDILRTWTGRALLGLPLL